MFRSSSPVTALPRTIGTSRRGWNIGTKTGAKGRSSALGLAVRLARAKACRRFSFLGAAEAAGAGGSSSRRSGGRRRGRFIRAGLRLRAGGPGAGDAVQEVGDEGSGRGGLDGLAEQQQPVVAGAP